MVRVRSYVHKIAESVVSNKNVQSSRGRKLFPWVWPSAWIRRHWWRHLTSRWIRPTIRHVKRDSVREQNADQPRQRILCICHKLWRLLQKLLNSQRDARQVESMTETWYIIHYLSLLESFTKSKERVSRHGDEWKKIHLGLPCLRELLRNFTPTPTLTDNHHS